MKTEGGVTRIFDAVRKKWLVLTPEEWVRQHVVNYLVEVQRTPVSVISIEKTIQLNDLTKRYDIVVYKDLRPWLVVECKAPFITLDNLVVEQALRYNLTLGAPFVMISNGVSDLVFNSENQQVALPAFLP